MPDPALTVTLARELEALVPGYLANRARDLQALRMACAAVDFEAIARIAHRIKGTGASYGFEPISACGLALETAAQAQDAAAAAASVAALADYLERLRVTYV